MAHERRLREGADSIVAAACACTVLLLLAATAAAAAKLRVGVNLTTIETLPIYLVEREGAGAGIAISGGNIPALTAGAVDVATHAETQAVRYSVANPDIRVILTVAEYANHLVASRRAGIRSAGDLRGRRVATVPDTTAHYCLVKTLESAGLSESDVTVVAMAPPDMAAALARGDVDAVSIWEPAAELSARALGADAVILQEAGYRERFDLNTTAAVLADPPRRAAVVDLVRAVIQTARTVRERPHEVQPVIAARLGLPDDIVTATWGLFRFPASLPDDLAATMVEQESWMALRQNRAPRPRAAIAALLDASVWREAAGESAGAAASPPR
ncbi:MAG: ABC transporter substrate-binding protein [Bradyrhizobiaceae bacterium]|nr:ABC transporter substrate-binding protein [Bradyrhizobiaceae bacterium]